MKMWSKTVFAVFLYIAVIILFISLQPIFELLVFEMPFLVSKIA